MKYPLRLLLTVGGFLATVSPAEAQTGSVIAEGARIRVTLHDRRVISGTAVPATGDSVALFTEANKQHAFSAASLTRLEVFEGRRRRIGRSALIGFAAGAVLGGIAGAAAGDACGIDPYQNCSSGESAAGGALLFGIAGATIGAIAGSFRRDVWNVRAPPWHIVPQ